MHPADRRRLVLLGLAVLMLGICILAVTFPSGGPRQMLNDWLATATATPTLTPTPTRTPTPTSTPTRTPKPPVPKIEVDAGQLVYVKHESQSRGPGLPDTYQYFEFRFFPAPPGSALRDYIRAVQRLAVPYMSEEEFEKNMAAFWAGNRALSNNHDYEENFAVGPVITGGAMARATGSVMYRSGAPFVEIYALNPENLPPVPASLAELDWTLHFRPTIVSQALRPDGRWRIHFFPQLDGQGIAPILGPNGRQWLNAANLVPIEAPVDPNEYPELQAWPTASPR